MTAIANTADDLVRARTTIGDFDLTVLTDGSYHLDGGAMFGVIPKPLWEKRIPADALNRIKLGLNTVVIRDGRQTVVIETGIGNKLAPKAREIYAAKELLPASFAAAGIRPEDVDIVINSHLHFDHCGWNTTRLPDGSIVPTFPNARYFAHRGEVEHGRRQLERDGISYTADNYEPLISNGQMTLLEGAFHQIVPGISVECYPGHTAQMLAVNITSAGQTACYISDLIPTSAHLDLTWGMCYDLDPLRIIEERKRFYARAIPEQWLVLFTHDHITPFGYLEINEKGRPVLKKAVNRMIHPESDLAALLLAFELQLMDPAFRRDRAAVSALLAHGFREFGYSGRFWSREATLDLLASESDYTRPTVEDFAVQSLSPAITLVTYRTVRPNLQTLRSSLWIRENAQWRILFHQGTKKPSV